MPEHSLISPQPQPAPAAAEREIVSLDSVSQKPYLTGFQRLPIQRKLTVGAVDDPLEAEADAMADRVMRMAEPSFIQRKCAHCQEEEQLQRKPTASFIQRKTDAGGTTVSESVSRQIQTRQGGGSPLPTPTKTFMESRFGANFSNVRIHSDAEAAGLSTRLNAQAFTVGSDIFFNAGKFSPDTSTGKALLAHELTHTVQQNGSLNRLIQRTVDQVEVNCADSQIRFSHDGTSTDYALDHCQVTDGTYDAAVSLGLNRVEFDLGIVPQGTQFDFGYSVAPGQPTPNTFFQNQRRVPVICTNTSRSAAGFGNIQFNARQLTPQEFYDLTGNPVDTIQEGVMVPLSNLLNRSLPSVVGPAGAGASYYSPTPWSFIPRDTTGVLWTQGHTSIFANPQGAFSPTIRGYRGNLGYYLGEMLPIIGRRFTVRLHEGVPGSFANDAWFPLMPGDQYYVFANRSCSQADAFAAQLQATQYGGEYTYSPPRSTPDPILGPVRPTEAGLRSELVSRGQAPLCTNNCITVPTAEIEAAIGTRPTTTSGVDVMTGRGPNGMVDPHYAGRGRLMTDAMSEGPLAEGLSRLRIQVTPGASASMFLIRGGGRVMLVYGIYHTEERIRGAIGTGQLPTVISEEAGSWTGGILGSALGGAAAGAVFCAPTGPLDAVCVVGGFVGGLLFGVIGGTIGHEVGNFVGENVVTPVVDKVEEVERDWTRNIYNLYGVPHF
ncbi:eCIS core domain-containing protein [Spirosoma radiotolerans]|uniref:eCIS core domain-containing protein n=1 Tax=Spirosoma radiotolerans TaxID=1379870 RepID=UPI0009E58DCB|nr:DUF4157 domain-containing protein [Spirosoma radiotolerans]